MRDLGRSPAASVARAIVGVGRALSLRVVAVGVEEPKQLELLRDQGCDAVQGHLVSPALPFDALVDWSNRWESTSTSPLMQTVADSLRGPGR